MYDPMLRPCESLSLFMVESLRLTHLKRKWCSTQRYCTDLTIIKDGNGERSTDHEKHPEKRATMSS